MLEDVRSLLQTLVKTSDEMLQNSSDLLKLKWRRYELSSDSGSESEAKRKFSHQYFVQLLISYQVLERMRPQQRVRPTLALVGRSPRTPLQDRRAMRLEILHAYYTRTLLV